MARGRVLGTKGGTGLAGKERVGATTPGSPTSTLPGAEQTGRDQLPKHLEMPVHPTGTPGGAASLPRGSWSPEFPLVRSTQVNFPSPGHEDPGPAILGCSTHRLQGVCAFIPPPIIIIKLPPRFPPWLLFPRPEQPRSVGIQSQHLGKGRRRVENKTLMDCKAIEVPASKLHIFNGI